MPRLLVAILARGFLPVNSLNGESLGGFNPFKNKLNDVFNIPVGGVDYRGIFSLLEGSNFFGGVGGIPFKQRGDGFMAAATGVYPPHPLFRVAREMKLVGRIGKYPGSYIAPFHNYTIFIGVVTL